jgi:hypothetical protein
METRERASRRVTDDCEFKIAIKWRGGYVLLEVAWFRVSILHLFDAPKERKA